MPPLSEYVSPAQRPNPILDPVVYFRVTAWALGLVTLLGIILTAMQPEPSLQALSLGEAFLQFTWWHNVLHLVLAATCALFGYASLDPKLVRNAAIAFGAVYSILGVAGFFVFMDAGTLALTPTLNIIHILLGGWALVAGILYKP